MKDCSEEERIWQPLGRSFNRANISSGDGRPVPVAPASSAQWRWGPDPPELLSEPHEIQSIPLSYKAGSRLDKAGGARWQFLFQERENPGPVDQAIQSGRHGIIDSKKDC